MHAVGWQSRSQRPQLMWHLLDGKGILRGWSFFRETKGAIMGVMGVKPPQVQLSEQLSQLRRQFSQSGWQGRGMVSCSQEQNSGQLLAQALAVAEDIFEMRALLIGL